MTLQEQVDKLAKFILEEVENEPSRNEGAIDTAIRIIRQQNEKSEQIWTHIEQIRKLLLIKLTK